MRDFLDNLIDRHADVAPQIKPRLPSIFEPEVSHGRLDVVVPDSDAPEMEETVAGPSVRTKKIAPSHVEPMDPPPFAEVTTPTTSVPVIQAMQPKAAPVVGRHQQIRPPEATVNEEPRPSVPQESRGSKNVPVPIVPATKEEAATDSYPIQTATSRELMGRVMGRVRDAHQQKPRERTSPNPQATAEEQTSVTEPVNRPVFSLSRREAPTFPPPSQASQGGGEKGEKGHTQGLLTPSATFIAPVIASPGGPERPVSQPEPIINVSIGRIEVRATPASVPQSQKTRSALPVMTLDEYLQRRSRGDR